MVAQPAHPQRQNHCAQVADAGLHARVQDIQPAALHQIGRQPGQEQVLGVVHAALHQKQSPHRLITQQLLQRHRMRIRCAPRRSVTQNHLPLRVAQPARLFRIAIHQQPHHHPDQTERPRAHEGQAPANRGHQPGDGDRRHRGAERRSRSRDRKRQGPFAHRRPLADRSCCQRKGWRFADAQQHAGEEQEGEACCRTAQRRGSRPERDASRRRLAGTPAVQHHPRRQLQRRVGPDEGRQKVADRDRRQRELLDQYRHRNRQHYAVEVVDQRHHEQQSIDDEPLAARPSPFDVRHASPGLFCPSMMPRTEAVNAIALRPASDRRFVCHRRQRHDGRRSKQGEQP